MKKNFLTLILILIGVCAIYFIRTYFSEHNMKKSILACVLAQKGTSESFNLKKANKYCEEKIRKEN